MSASNLVAFLFLLIKLIDIKASSSAEASLELLQILYRHGDRTPLSVYPTDSHANLWKDQGLGQLTNLGKEQQLELGEFIRQHYSEFLNDTYDARLVTVRSTDVDRTLMSAQANLAGLYPPVRNQIWNATIRWQPIPVHTVPESTDYLLKAGYNNCPKYREITDDVMSSKEVQQIINDNKDLLDLVTNGTGTPVNSLKTITDIYDTIFIEKLYNLTIPNWVSDDVLKRLRQLDALFFVYESHTDLQKRLSGGPLLSEMIAHANSKILGTNNQKRLYIYSGHDTTVASLLAALGVFNGISPPYASTVFVELLRLPNSTYALQILYRNTTNNEPYVLTIPDCISPCPIERVIELTKAIVPDDIFQECQSTSKSIIPWTVAIITGVLTLLFVVALLAGFLYCRRKKRADGDYRYTIVNDD